MSQLRILADFVRIVLVIRIGATASILRADVLLQSVFAWVLCL